MLSSFLGSGPSCDRALARRGVAEEVNRIANARKHRIALSIVSILSAITAPDS
jgi:hypothetical protein